MDRDESPTPGVSAHLGFPNPAIDKSLLNLDLNQLLIQRPASTFMFRITGDDWVGAGLFAGDIAIIDRALDPRKNDLVLWWHEPTGEFAISALRGLPRDAALWGVITHTIHQFRTAP